jgi:hypothetical protein
MSTRLIVIYGLCAISAAGLWPTLAYGASAGAILGWKNLGGQES